MYTFAFLLTIISMVFEYELVKRVSFVRFILVKSHPVVGLIFSCILSVVLGGLFGADGLTVMFAGVGSTVAMQPIYKMMKAGTWDPTVSGAKFIAKIVLFPLRLLGVIINGSAKLAAKFDRQ